MKNAVKKINYSNAKKVLIFSIMVGASSVVLSSNAKTQNKSNDPLSGRYTSQTVTHYPGTSQSDCNENFPGFYFNSKLKKCINYELNGTQIELKKLSPGEYLVQAQTLNKYGAKKSFSGKAFHIHFGGNHKTIIKAKSDPSTYIDGVEGDLSSGIGGDCDEITIELTRNPKTLKYENAKVIAFDNNKCDRDLEDLSAGRNDQDNAAQ